MKENGREPSKLRYEVRHQKCSRLSFTNLTGSELVELILSDSNWPIVLYPHTKERGKTLERDGRWNIVA